MEEVLHEKVKFTDSQIMDAVKRVEAGFGVPDICREMGISTATFYKWRAKYGGMDFSMISRMKELEEENRRLKKMYLEEKLKADDLPPPCRTKVMEQSPLTVPPVCLSYRSFIPEQCLIDVFVAYFDEGHVVSIHKKTPPPFGGQG